MEGFTADGLALLMALARDHKRVSGSQHVDGCMNRFAAIAGGDTFGVSKPDPQHLWKTIEAAGGGRAIMVGDSDADVGAAKAAGVPAVAVSFGYSQVPATQLGADAVIDHFDELAALAERLLGL